MKYAMMLAAALSMIAWSVPAQAKCPPGTMYQCTQGYNGKVVCGCR